MVTPVKEKISLGLAYSSKVWSIMVMAGSRVASDRHGTREVAESSASGFSGGRKETVSHWAQLELRRPQSPL